MPAAETLLRRLRKNAWMPGPGPGMAIEAAAADSAHTAGQGPGGRDEDGTAP